MDAPVDEERRPRGETGEWGADGTGDVVAGSVRSCLAAIAVACPSVFALVSVAQSKKSRGNSG